MNVITLTRFIVELHNEGIYVYFMNGYFSFKKLSVNSKLVTLKISELKSYVEYLTLAEFVTMIKHRMN